MGASNLGSPTASTSLIKIFFTLDDDDWHGYETESVWVELVSGNRYRLRNTPFFAKGVSFEDVVFAKDKDGDLLFESTSIAAGHSTYRILVDKTISDDDFSRYWKPLERLGCTYESADRKKMILYAVDVPSKADIYQVYELLDKGEKDGIWGFEEGHCGHPLKES